MKKALTVVFFLSALRVLAQSTTGELRLTVTDPAGAGVTPRSTSSARALNIVRHSPRMRQGEVDAKRLPYGIYHLQIQAKGFAAVSEPVDIRSALPLDRQDSIAC